jgi:hypothetical protein
VDRSLVTRIRTVATLGVQVLRVFVPLWQLQLAVSYAVSVISNSIFLIFH